MDSVHRIRAEIAKCSTYWCQGYILYIYILEHVERMSALFASVLCAFRDVQKAGKRMALPTGILAGLSCSMPSFADFNAALQTYFIVP